MIVSTKGRYALRVIIDLAQNNTHDYIPMKEVAKRQEISLKYLEKILPILAKNKLIEGVSGKGGGYRLTKKIEEYTVYEILSLTEGDLAPVNCLKKNKDFCPRKDSCKTFILWKNLDNLIKNYLDKITIKDIINNNLQ